MGTIKDAIYLENISEVKRILEEGPNLIDEKMRMVCLWHCLRRRPEILHL